MYGSTAGKQAEINDRGLHGIESDLQALSSNVSRIGTASDSATLRENISSLRGQLKRKISNEQDRQANEQQRLMRDRLQVPDQLVINSKQLRMYVSRLYQLMETEQGLLQRHPSPHSTAAEEANWGGGTTPHTVPLLQAAAMADATSAEREVEALEEIQRDLGDLHAIQSDLAGLVLNQREDISVIEANVEVAGNRVERGRRELKKGAEYRGSSRRKKCCIAVCILVAIVIPTLVLIALIILLVHFLSK